RSAGIRRRRAARCPYAGRAGVAQARGSTLAPGLRDGIAVGALVHRADPRPRRAGVVMRGILALALLLVAGRAIAGMPFGGDDAGFVPPDAATFTCESTVEKHFAKPSSVRAPATSPRRAWACAATRSTRRHARTA